MTIEIELRYLLSLIAGIAILIQPRFLNYIVAAYLIVVGLFGIFNVGNV